MPRTNTYIDCDAVNRVREKLRWSVQDLLRHAPRVGVSRNTAYRICKATGALPARDLTVISMAIALGVEPSELRANPPGGEQA